MVHSQVIIKTFVYWFSYKWSLDGPFCLETTGGNLIITLRIWPYHFQLIVLICIHDPDLKCLASWSCRTCLIFGLSLFSKQEHTVCVSYHRKLACLSEPMLLTFLLAGADPGFLERGFICISGGRFADLFSFFLHILWKWNNLVSLRPNYFIFIGYLKIGGKDGGSVEPPWTPLDPPLVRYQNQKNDCPLSYFQLAHINDWPLLCFRRSRKDVEQQLDVIQTVMVARAHLWSRGQMMATILTSVWSTLYLTEIDGWLLGCRRTQRW